MALLASAGIVPAVAQSSPDGFDIVPALDKTLPSDLGNLNDSLANLFGLSPDSSAAIDAGIRNNVNDFNANNGSAAQGFDTRNIRSGNVSSAVDISNSGDNSNVCSTAVQTTNTGNVVNQQSVVQSASESDDIGLEGSSIAISPTASGTCTQTVDHAFSSR
jgi:hypothetical protein